MDEPLVADYILKKTIWLGSTGKVKLAEHKITHDQVAIKIIKNHFSSQTQKTRKKFKEKLL